MVKKILQLVPSMGAGGVEQGTYDVALALLAAGQGSHVASSPSQDGKSDVTSKLFRLKKNGVIHHPINFIKRDPLHFVMARQQLIKVIRQEGISLIHARSRFPAWVGLAAAKACGIPFMTTFHGVYNFSNNLKLRYNSVMVRGVKTIAVSQYIQNHILDHYQKFGITADKIKVITRGIDCQRFDPNMVSAERLRILGQQWRLPDDVPIIMLPGRVTRWKGHELLLKSLSQIKDQPFHCIFVGDENENPNYTKQLFKQISHAGLGGRVQFVGACQEMAVALMLADIVVSASTDPEAFGRVVVEAQAMGRQVIAPQHGGAVEQIEQGKTGWLFKPSDADSLASNLRVVLGLSLEQRQNLSHASRDSVLQNFSLDSMLTATIDIYRQILDDGGV